MEILSLIREIREEKMIDFIPETLKVYRAFEVQV